MADIKLKYQGNVQSLNVTGFNSLAGAAYAHSDAVDNSSDLFIDVMVEVVVADITEAGNKQVVVYVIDSIDGTNFSHGNASSAEAAANPQALRLLGVIPMNGTGPWRSAMMSVASAFGGIVPPKWKVLIMNDNSTTALAGSGNTVQYRGIHYQSV